MLVQFTVTLAERDRLLAHANVNSPRWNALMESVPVNAPDTVLVKCERAVAVDILGIAVTHCDPAAKAIITALDRAVRG